MTGAKATPGSTLLPGIALSSMIRYCSSALSSRALLTGPRIFPLDSSGRCRKDGLCSTALTRCFYFVGPAFVCEWPLCVCRVSNWHCITPDPPMLHVVVFPSHSHSQCCQNFDRTPVDNMYKREFLLGRFWKTELDRNKDLVAVHKPK